MQKVLDHYKQEVDKALEGAASRFGDVSDPLYKACKHALMGGGKRFRPVLVLMVAEALGCPWSVMEAALAVEFFHTASLLADDLPCMDNDDFRRGRPTTHRVYGESVALLVSYALIAEGFGAIFRCVEGVKRDSSSHVGWDRVGMLALENAARNTGVDGIIGGQLSDLYLKEASVEQQQKLMRKKTGTLFEISFVFGWLFGGGELSKLDSVKKLANHFGVAFQIADDFDDVKQDAKQENPVNIVLSLGEEKAYKFFCTELDFFTEGLRELGIRGGAFDALCSTLRTAVATEVTLN